jgi:D-beta-D-heptose 7-phosphate kinase / D-beta-D-heptose 1-phosphate adenosyltransferase
LTKKILVVGDIMLDRYHQCSVTRISPEAPVPVANIVKTKSSLGGAANVAHCLKVLGADVTLMGACGIDTAADEIKKLTSEIGVETSFLESCHFQTTVKTRIAAGSQQLIRIDQESMLKHEDSAKIKKLFAKQFDKFDCVVFSDYAKGTLALVKDMIKLLNQNNIISFVDPKRDDFSTYAGATYVKPNEIELAKSCAYHKIPNDLKGAFDYFNANYDIKNLLVTLGKSGASLYSKDSVFSQRSSAQAIFDVTGAGDAFLGGFVLSVLSDLSSEESLVTASNISAEVISRLGTVQPNFPLNFYHSECLQMQHEIDVKINQIKILKEQGKKIIFTNGCFDILHLGHVNYLKSAKELGEVLVIGINDDLSIKRLKGADRPINTLNDRKSMLENLSCVDYVIPFSNDTPASLIELINPNLLVKGGDYIDEETLVGFDFMKKNGGEVKLLQFHEGYSTTNIIDRIRDI